jgi:hypothetical protein
MSSNTVHSNYAPLDTAYSPSAPMAEFENRLKPSGGLMGNSGCMISSAPQTENQVNQNIDQLLDRYDPQPYAPSILSQSQPQLLMNNSQQQSTGNFGSELLENFNLQQSVQNAANEIEQSAHNVAGMSFSRFLLLVFLVVVLIYCFYWLYKRDSVANVLNCGKEVVKTGSTMGSSMGSTMNMLKNWY